MEEDALDHVPDVSVIIPVYDDVDRLAGCLRAIARQEYPGRIEICVVDNGELPTVAAALGELDATTKVIHEPRPGSYTARNAGLRATSGEVIAFTDADCVPASGWLAAGVARLRSDEQVGLVAGRIALSVEDPRKPTGVELYECLHGFPQERYVAESHFGATANVILRRRAVEEVGGFDDGLRSGGDKDLGRRVHAAGYQVVYEPSALVVHPARRTWRALRAKHARTVAGYTASRQRDGYRWHQFLRDLLRTLKPPVGSIARGFLDPRLRGVSSLRYGWTVLRVRYTGSWLRLRSYLGAPAPR